MSGHVGSDFQKSVYDALNASLELQTALGGSGRIFDSVPDNQAYPYVEIGDDTAIDNSTCEKPGQELTITIHSWSRTRGRKEVKGIMRGVYDVLHYGSFTMPGNVCILSIFDFEQILADPDGVTFHGVQRFRVLTQEE